MKNNPVKKGEIAVNSQGIGGVTQEMVKQRAAENAKAEDRPMNDADYQQARRELTDNGDQDSKEEILESAPESDRWNIPAGSVGHKIEPPSNEDEDEDGRSDNERLVEQGVADAETDQVRQASRGKNSR